MTTQEQQKVKFHITYKVEEKTKEVITFKETEELAKQDVRDLYGDSVEVEFLEVINTSEL